MPITKSAKKALRGSMRKRRYNERRKSAVRRTAKGLRKAVHGKDDTKEPLAKAYKAIDKAAKRGVMKKNTASRRKAALAAFVKREAQG